MDKSHLVITHVTPGDGRGWVLHFGVLGPDGTVRPLDVMAVNGRIAESLQLLLDEMADSDAATMGGQGCVGTLSQ